ncbi:MAG: type III-B CRISPR module RAMP protein Cmr4 [Acetobacteraceae bacterium]
MIAQPYLLHALSPLHAGVGQAAELIDLPIARLKGTGIPFVPGSSIKGVLRDTCTQTKPASVDAVFGPDRENANKHAGALVCTDARLLALPVRSFRGTFAYVTSPLLLTLAARDLDRAPAIPKPPVNTCMATEATLAFNGMVHLEDLDLRCHKPDKDFEAWRDRLGEKLGMQQVFRNRFAIVDDEVMTFLWETATQLDQRVRISSTTRTVEKGALWLEESLPPETLLIGLLVAEPSRHPDHRMKEEDVLEAVLPAKPERVLQFGGKSTVGRGRCRMMRL